MSKKRIAMCAVAACLALVMSGCQDSGENPDQATGRLLRTDGCKSFSQDGAAGLAVASSEDCLEYRFDGSVLRLKHVNACFNCCPGEVRADVRVSGRGITITESEQMAGCYCQCLFDLDLEVDNLPPGSYLIQVIEPYVPEGEEPLTFAVQLEAGAAGRFCVERATYPWDVSPNG